MLLGLRIDDVNCASDLDAAAARFRDELRVKSNRAAKVSAARTP
jgi:hypothetical protein